MHHNQALANKQHDRQSLKDLQVIACESCIVLPAQFSFIGTFIRVLVLSKLSLDDKETIRTIRQGHTVGVFQLSGNAITQYIKRVKPWDFDTIVDISALNWQNGAVKAGYMLGSPKACGTLIA